MDTPIIQSAREDKDAIIRCMVTGDPEPTVSWYFNGQLLNSKFNFKSVFFMCIYKRMMNKLVNMF